MQNPIDPTEQRQTWCGEQNARRLRYIRGVANRAQLHRRNVWLMLRLSRRR